MWTKCRESNGSAPENNTSNNWVQICGHGINFGNLQILSAKIPCSKIAHKYVDMTQKLGTNIWT